MTRLGAALEDSAVLGAARTVRRWARHSVVGRLLASEWFLQSVGTLVLLLSVVSVLRSDMDTAEKFLGFALLFVLTAGLTVWIVRQTAE